LPTNGKETRRILNEAHTITYFPHSAGGKLKYLLEECVGLDRKQMAYIKKKQRSRACTIFKNYPQCYMLEHEIGLLDMESDEEVPKKKKGNKKKETAKQKKEEEEEEDDDLPVDKL
jgi:hypothetical protein